jgi:hypothetical protein
LLRKNIPAAVYGCFLLIAGWLAYTYPYNDWDVLAYVGCAINLTESDQVKLHKEVFEQAREELPEEDFAEMTTSVPFRRDVAANPWHFAEQLPFYSIRPLYIQLLAWIHRLGATYFQATKLVSSIALGLLGFSIFLWMRERLGAGDAGWRAALISGLLLLTPPLFLAGRTASPDAISGLFTVTAVYLLTQKHRIFPAAVLLLSSIFLRSDNVILVGMILCWYSWPLRQGADEVRIPPVKAAVLLLLAAASVLTVNHFSGHYGWATLMRNTFTDAISTPGETVVTVSWGDYLEDAKELAGITAAGSMVAFVLLAVLALVSGRASRRSKELIWVIFAALAVRLALFPHLEDRYFVAQYTILAVAAVPTLLARAGAQPSSTE